MVEIEEPVRRLAHEFLQSHGYQVLEAATGEDAMRVAARHPGTIHLLLTDVVMPGMNGSELAERLVGERPEMKVLYMSGYTESPSVHRAVLNRTAFSLQKPFTQASLMRKVRAVLDE